MSKLIENLYTRREEYAVARVLIAAILTADSVFGETAVETQMSHAGRQRCAANVANDVSLGQIENAISMLRMAMEVKQAGGLVWNAELGHFDLPGSQPLGHVVKAGHPYT